MSTRRVPGPAGLLAVDDGGEGGVPVLFAHSAAGTAAHWSAQLGHVRASRRAVALDLRGHGGSEPASDGDYSIEGMADDVLAVADALGLRRFVLVGHSLGGGVALVFAARHPERVERLLLVDPVGDGTQLPAEQIEPFLQALESPGYAEAIEGYWATIAGPDPAVRERLLHDLHATPRPAVVGAMHAVSRFDPKPALERYQGPTLAVVTPSNDLPFSLHHLGGGLPHRVVEGTGHWLQLDQPGEFNRILDRFLEEGSR